MKKPQLEGEGFSTRQRFQLRQALREEVERETWLYSREMPRDLNAERELCRRVMNGLELEKVPHPPRFYAHFHRHLLLAVEMVREVKLEVTTARVMMALESEGYVESCQKADVVAELEWIRAGVYDGVSFALQRTSELSERVTEAWRKRKLLDELQKAVGELYAGEKTAADVYCQLDTLRRR